MDPLRNALSKMIPHILAGRKHEFLCFLPLSFTFRAWAVAKTHFTTNPSLCHSVSAWSIKVRSVSAERVRAWVSRLVHHRPDYPGDALPIDHAGED